MQGRRNALSAYGQVANAETDPIQQIVMLYDGAVKFLRLAASDIESGDMVKKGEHTNRALDIISYLQSILDFESGGDVAQALDNLYTSLNIQILKASASLDAGLMINAAGAILPVRDAWASAVKTSRAPVAQGATASQKSYQHVA
jgi:flagellar protein FliS